MPRLSSFEPTLRLRTNHLVEELQTRHRIITGYLFFGRIEILK